MTRLRHPYGNLGFLRWSRQHWIWLFVELQGRAFGVYIDQVRGEVVFVLGCRVLLRSTVGTPQRFAGGVHWTW